MQPVLEQLDRVRYPVAGSYSLPPACYTSEDWFGREQAQLFASGWVGIGRRDQWREAGDFLTLELAGTPLVVVQGGDGQLNALSNACLHRSSLLAEGAGNCRALVCPFHGWSYRLDGRLVSAPRMESATAFDAESLCLPRFALQECDGFVFVSLAPEPAALEDILADFSDIHASWSLSSLVSGRSRTFDVDCNWKLFIEVFNEYYHLPYVHPGSISHYYPEPDAADDVMGEFTTQFGETSANPAVLDDSQDIAFPQIPGLGGRDARGTRYTWIYPNVTFAASSDCLWMYHVFPLGAASTRVVQTVCFPPETVALPDFEARARLYYHRFDVAIDEDIPALVRQQRGMSSPAAAQGRFSTLEPSVGNFACWYAERLREG